MAAKSEPFTMRMSKPMEELVEIEARRTGRSKGAVVEALADEALRMRLFPGIAFRGAGWERRAWVIGTAFDVWQLIEAYQDLGSVQQMVADGSVTEHHVRLALDYYERFTDEIDQAIAENRRPLDQLEREFPFIAVSRG